MPPLDTDIQAADEIRELDAKIEDVNETNQELDSRIKQCHEELSKINDDRKNIQTQICKVKIAACEELVKEDVVLNQQIACDDAFSMDAAENLFNWFNLKMAQV